MTKHGNYKEREISKFLVLIMIIVIFIAIGVYAWYFFNGSDENFLFHKSTTSEESNNTETNQEQTESIDTESSDPETARDEIDALDKDMNSINDDDLSESTFSDNDLEL